MKILISSLSILILVLTVRAQSQFEMPNIFAANMVLQQNSSSPLWGKANPGAKITLSANWNEQVSTRANENSLWQVDLPTPQAGGPYTLMIESGSEIIELEFEGCPAHNTVV
jgi:sialate O-acetylesterase